MTMPEISGMSPSQRPVGLVAGGAFFSSFPCGERPLTDHKARVWTTVFQAVQAIAMCGVLAVAVKAGVMIEKVDTNETEIAETQNDLKSLAVAVGDLARATAVGSANTSNLVERVSDLTRRLERQEQKR